LIDALSVDRVLAVVRAAKIPDVAGLCNALLGGGIRVVELTFTTPELPRLLAEAARTDVMVGAGTVLSAENASQAVEAGAQYLVTPGLGLEAADIVRIGHDAGVDVVLGAMTPSEVMTAMQLGADLIKIFPARVGGPQLCADLRGPFPDVRLLPSGGVTADNAQAFLDAGCLAVTAGTGVVPPEAVESSDWATVTERTREFLAHLAR
jgi:2-dehydro-3-deoxyphosphogluconate aldolase/(4S)-4-hydroxy-2-oxoglutarate aldolase